MVKLALITALVACIPAFISANAAAAHEYKSLEMDFDYRADENEESPRSMILMVPDGTGPNVYKLARGVLDPTLEKRLHLDRYLTGQVQTHSATSYITDSASSATSYATGYKTYDRGIGVDLYKRPLGTILEAAKARGMVTGMIVTSRVTHATPASFATHVEDRDNENEIARQYVQNKNLDFLLGGGSRHFTPAMIEDLKNEGYAIAENYGQLENYKNENEEFGSLRVFGLFAKSHMSYEVDRVREMANLKQQTRGEREPSLSEMVDTILSILKNNEEAKKNGFFLMIEGSRVDHAGHSNDPGGMAKDAIAFDEAAGVVLQYVRDHDNVAMMSVADHGTGGMTLAIDGVYDWKPKDLQRQKMSTEWMENKLKEVLKSSDCTGANAPKPDVGSAVCQATMSKTAAELLRTNTALNVEGDKAPKIVEDEIKLALGSAKVDTLRILVSLGRAISKQARIGWTTTGHVGTDVDLHCAGPDHFVRECRGVHENTHINKIMTNYLNIVHRQKVETLRLRNATTIEYSEGDKLGNGKYPEI